MTDISAGGIRVYSDDKYKPGENLELELFFSDVSSVTLMAQVVWVEELTPGDDAAYDVGLRYVNPTREVLERIEHVLSEAG